ncbi:MAG: glycoside hydrolase family 71/99 protein [Saccharofermentanales bacterium]
MKIEKSQTEGLNDLKAIPEDSGVFLSWVKSPGAIKYSLFRSDSLNGDYKLLAGDLKSENYIDTGLLNRKTYYYCIKYSSSKFSNKAKAKPDVEAYAWYFNKKENATDGWNVENSNYLAINGELDITANHEAPCLKSPELLRLDASKYNKLEICLRNKTNASKLETHWTTEPEKAETERIDLASSDKDYVKYVFDLKNHDGWKGAVNDFCIDFASDDITGNLRILYIKFLKNDGIKEKTKKPLVGAIRWDAWSKAMIDQLHWCMEDWFYTDYGYREPVNGWLNSDVPEGSLPDYMEITEKEIDYAVKNGLDYWAYDFIPTSYPGCNPGMKMVEGPLNNYLASAKKKKPKFALIVMPVYEAVGGNGELYFDDYYVPELISYFKKPEYLKVEKNRPMLFILPASSLDKYGDWEKHKHHFDIECVKAGLGKPLLVSLAGFDTANCVKYHCEGISNYGPTYGKVFDKTKKEHRSWKEMAAMDFDAFNASDQVRYVASLSPVMDPRGLVYYSTPTPEGSPTGMTGFMYEYYYDIPTYKQWEDHFKFFYENLRQYPGRTTDNPGTMLIYAWNELSEGGPGIVPTKQYKTMFLDAIKAVKTGDYPKIYSEILNDDSVDERMSYYGEWIHTAPSYADRGYFNNDHSSSSRYGDFLQVAQNTGDCIGFEVIGPVDDNLGKLEIYIDDFTCAVAVVDCYSKKHSASQILYRGQEPLKPGNHILKVKVLGEMNKKSKSCEIKIDCVKIIRQR